MSWLPERFAIRGRLVTLYWRCRRCGHRISTTRSRRLPRAFWMDAHDVRLHGGLGL
jgi:hypothetical protein